ncbi:uncharacterized protein LOC119111965 isoform X2 [Pollicipes pollicipes]|uniref:uncharacterized protein LOC119111965 isoform X2 n=1 Tax=Pollicipes pollicipes TaxID=41117 RepID=UPI00188551C7|nr:uncharacterized protein LOC119111965 isoform X2 [Pollicipes pollicipes]
MTWTQEPWHHLTSARSLSLPDVTSLRRIAADLDENCPVCGMPFDQGMKRKITDACSHERCYTCMTQYQSCPLCTTQGAPAKKVGFPGKTAGGLLGSALGSSVSSLFHGRPKMKTNGHFAAFMQARHDNGLSPGRDTLSASPLRDIGNRSGGYLAPAAGRLYNTPPSSRRRVVASPKLLRLAARQNRKQPLQYDRRGQSTGTLSPLPGKRNWSGLHDNSAQLAAVHRHGRGGRPAGG